MNISLKQVRAFVTLSECRTYAEAADKLHLSQPALSLAIKALEDAVGGPLLKRTTRAFSLTPEGQSFLGQARELLNDWDDTIGSLKDRFQLKSGALSIAVMPTFAATVLPKAIKHFKGHHPGISVSLNDVIAEEAVEMVRRGKVEVGISFRPKVMDDVDFSPLFRDYFVAVLPSYHLFASKHALAFRDVLDQPLLLLQPPSLVSELIQSAATSQGYDVNVMMQAHQLATIGRMVSEGLGLSIVPKVCSTQMTEMGTVWRPLEDVDISSDIGVITRKRHALSAAASSFIRVLENEFRKDLNA